MPTYSNNLAIVLIGSGDESGNWGNVTNDNFENGLDEAITATATVAFSGADVPLDLPDQNPAISKPARHMRLNLTGTAGGSPRYLSLPNKQKLFVIYNDTDGAITVKNTTGSGASVTIPVGKTLFIYNDGTDVLDAVNYLSNLTLGTPLPVASGGTGSNTGVNVQTSISGILPVANGGTGSSSATFSGANITSLNATAISSGTLDNARTSASSSNGASTIVARDASGNFSANTITAALIGSVTGTASGNLSTSSFTGSNQSLSSSGYQKFPGGLILQWGSFTQSSGGYTDVSLPTTFPSACTHANAIKVSNSTGGVDITPGLRSVSTTTVSFNCQNGFDYYWFALGY